MAKDVRGRLGYLIKRTQQALRSAMDATLAEVDLSTPQYAALNALEAAPGISNAELARRCFVTPQTMHQLVIRLEEEERIERTPHPEHGRIRQVRLTEAGRSALQQAHERVEAVEEKMTESLDEEEHTCAARALVKCYEGLESS